MHGRLPPEERCLRVRLQPSMIDFDEEQPDREDFERDAHDEDWRWK